jgi:hypothetical protein
MSYHESPSYTLIMSEPPFEIRLYENFSIVEYDNDADLESDGGFRTLFSYISQENASKAKISMTVPVFERVKGQGKKMAFVVPKAYSGNVPAPLNPYLKVETIEPTQFAVIRFSGLMRRTKEQQQLTLLKDWAKRKHLNLIGEPIIAYYNAPFTPPFLRRNEVLMAISVDEKHITHEQLKPEVVF